MGDYDVLGVFAATLMDTQQVRIATENRLRAAEDYPKGVPVKNIEPSTALGEMLKATWERLTVTEKSLTLALTREVHRTPLGPWVKGTTGIGEVVVGRFLGFAGDPAVIVDRETGEIAPRKLSQFRQYCGYGAPLKRKRGEKANWSPGAKSWAYLMAEKCIMQTGVRGKRSPYRDVYESAKLKYADATHAETCARCGPKGSPALAGSPLSDGHKNMCAMRVTVKEILADMWRVSVAAHGFVFVDPWRDQQLSDIHLRDVAPSSSGGHVTIDNQWIDVAGSSSDREEVALAV